MNALEKQNLDYSRYILERLHQQIYVNPEDKQFADPRREVFIEKSDIAVWLYASPLPNMSISERKILAVICPAEIQYSSISLQDTCSVTIYMDSERKISERCLDNICETFLKEKGEIMYHDLICLSESELVKRAKGGV